MLTTPNLYTCTKHSRLRYEYLNTNMWLLLLEFITYIAYIFTTKKVHYYSPLEILPILEKKKKKVFLCEHYTINYVLLVISLS